MVLGLTVAAIWAYLFAARGGFWRMREDPPEGALPSPAPSVTAVIPARNEAETVGLAAGSLARQKYPGEFRIVVVDDASDDGTAEAARAAAPPELLTVIRAESLPEGWTGKLWAVAQGVRQSLPDYYLLTDADIVHPPENVAALAARAGTGGYDLVSYMATLRCETAAERALVPAFVFFFFMLYPPAWIRSPRRRTAGAAGGCMLVRRIALERIGGIEHIRGELIDDCALARAIKRSGGRVWLGLNADTRSIRRYETFGEIGRMISRTAFTQLHYSTPMLMATLAGLALTYMAPPVLALTGSWYGAAAWGLMAACYIPGLRFYRRSWLWAPLLPLIAIFYAAATVQSAVAYWRGAGGMWKGRPQA
jgi:hopene-associated glycosyltransferase HpnB